MLYKLNMRVASKTILQSRTYNNVRRKPTKKHKNLLRLYPKDSEKQSSIRFYMRTGESNYYNIPSKSHLAGSIIRIRQGKQKSANGQLPSVSRLYFQSAGISVHLFQATQHTIHTYRSSTKESGGPVLSLPRGHYRE